MKLVSESELASLTGKSWRTVKRRLTDAGLDPTQKEGPANLYASDQALDAIYAPDALTGELDLQTERARLAKWQADKTEQDVQLRGARMLEMDAVEFWVAGMLSTVKARLVQIPDAVGQHVDEQHTAAVTEAVRRYILEALADLSAEGERGPAALVARAQATADPDGERMGGPIPEVVRRKQRRAGAVAN